MEHGTATYMVTFYPDGLGFTAAIRSELWVLSATMRFCCSDKNLVDSPSHIESLTTHSNFRLTTGNVSHDAILLHVDVTISVA